jgi:hypothetical protein
LSAQFYVLAMYQTKYDFGDNDKITIVWTGVATKKYVAVLSVLNLVSNFVKCNRLVVSTCLEFTPDYYAQEAP